MAMGMGAARGAVKKAAKKAGRAVGKKAQAGAMKVARQVPGYGEVTGSGVKQNRAGKVLRRIARGK